MWTQLKYQAFAEAVRDRQDLQKHLFHVPSSQGKSSVPSSTPLCNVEHRSYRGFLYFTRVDAAHQLSE